MIRRGEDGQWDRNCPHPGRARDPFSRGQRRRFCGPSVPRTMVLLMKITAAERQITRARATTDASSPKLSNYILLLYATRAQYNNIREPQCNRPARAERRLRSSPVALFVYARVIIVLCTYDRCALLCEVECARVYAIRARAS